MMRVVRSKRSAWSLLLVWALLCGSVALAQSPAPAPDNQPAAAAPAAMPPADSAAAPAPAAPSPSAPVNVQLPRDLTPWGMFLAADIIVKIVMIGLAFASVLTWTIWLAKVFELLMARKRLQNASNVLAGARSLSEAISKLKRETDAGNTDMSALIRAAETELRLSADALDPAGVKERLASRLERLEAAAGRRMNRGTGLLATIGATAPFVGLFGTVWGIMNSFIGISKQQTTNLAVVAPGIAEALLATALGLVAAIPAVVLYNMFARWIASYRMAYAETSAEILRLVSRDFDRGAIRPGRRVAAE